MIRPFEPEDWPVFIRMMHQLHDEGATSSLTFRERDMLESIAQPNLFNVLAETADGEVVGVCVGWIEKVFFGPDLIATQHILYVMPHMRGRVYGRELLTAFENFARERSAKEMWVSQGTGIDAERTQKFFELHGFETVGCVARKQLWHS